MNIADRLKELRKKAGYSQEQLAGMLDVSRQAVSKWESAQGNPDIENLVKLTKIYHVSADYILTVSLKLHLNTVSFVDRPDDGFIDFPDHIDRKVIRFLSVLSSVEFSLQPASQLPLDRI